MTTTMDADPYAGVLGLVETQFGYLESVQHLGSVPGARSSLNLRNRIPEQSTVFRFVDCGSTPATEESCCTRSVCTFGSHRPELSDCDWKRGRVLAAVQYVDLEKIEDGFDVDQNPSDWNNLLGISCSSHGTNRRRDVCGERWMNFLAAVFLPDGVESQEGCGDCGSGCLQPLIGDWQRYSQTDGAGLSERPPRSWGSSYDTAEENAYGLHLFQFVIADDKVAAKDGGGIDLRLPIDLSVTRQVFRAGRLRAFVLAWNSMEFSAGSP